MQTQTSCVFVNMEAWTGCFWLGCSDRREEEDEEEERGQPERISYSEDVWNRKLLKEKPKFLPRKYCNISVRFAKSSGWFLWCSCKITTKRCDPELTDLKNWKCCIISPGFHPISANICQNKQRNGKWSAFFQSNDSSKHCTIHATFTHSYTDDRGCNARCQLLIRDFHMQLGGAGIRNGDLPITRRPALPTEPITNNPPSCRETWTEQLLVLGIRWQKPGEATSW